MLDAPIANKIQTMNQRVRWRHPLIIERGIDQTALVLEEGQAESPEFSFLVVGDTGAGSHTDHHPQRRIAEQMLPHHPDCRFLLHTGDVVYQVGSREQYPRNFIHPYREFLIGGEQPDQIAYDGMTFKLPFLPVPGNHDYYNLPWLYGALLQIKRPLKWLLGRALESNLGWQGSYTGDIYARAFLDYLQGLPPSDALVQHLEQHYTAHIRTGRCLRYQPGRFTRLPNRYYTLRYGGVDFFALDSSTFNAPSPLPTDAQGTRCRQMLLAHRREVEAQEQQVYAEASRLPMQSPDGLERIDDLQAKIEQLAEIQLDIDKQLQAQDTDEVDFEQLHWLQTRLIESWHDPDVRARVLYFHHPPYVTETTKWHQGQTLAVRHHLRWVLDGVAQAVKPLTQGRPLVDLILNGHAHCLEYLRTGDTGHADSHLNWIICGGSGFSLRRQRADGAELTEVFPASESSKLCETRSVAKSQLFVGLSGHRSERRRPYSFLRIDIKAGTPPKFRVRPYISERYHQEWHDYALDPLVL
jgi:hypothetical protein